MARLWIVLGIAAFVIAGVVYGLSTGQSDNVPTETESTVSTSTPVDETSTPTVTESGTTTQTTATTTYTLGDVAAHATPEDCWFAVDGSVYNITPYIEAGKHPGGSAVELGCGTDATELYRTRPMGSGTPHSEKATAYLENFLIGTLAK